MLRRPALSALLSCALALACGTSRGDGDPGISGRLLGESGRGTKDAPPLRLIAEKKLSHLLHGDRFEASGVEYEDGDLWVVFDDRTDVARVDEDLSKGEWIQTGTHGPGYEGIAYAGRTRRFYCVVESIRREHRWQGRVACYDHHWKLEDESWLDVDLPEENKGYEGLAFVERGGRQFLLALREGDPDDIDEHGGVRGRIDVFRQKTDGDGWKLRGTLKLPKKVDFTDYSGIDVQDDRVAIVSQASSRLWVGRLEGDDWAWKDDGRVWSFPGEDQDGPVYRTVEGVAWLDPGRIAVCSDLLQDGHRGREHDESIAIFALAAGGE
jgi:hypothetical protein